MNPPWQPPDPKRFRPNDPTSERPWIPPPHHAHTHPHQPPVHPSRQSQLPPPPPIAPYHQPPPPAPAPYYPPHAPTHNPHHNPPYPHHNPNPPYYPPTHPNHTHPPPHSHNPHHAHSQHRRNKSSDPRQRHRNGNPELYPSHHTHHTHHPTHPLSTLDPPHTDNTDKSGTILDVLHIASDETKNFGSFAVTLSQIYGSRNMDGLPFGNNSNDSIEFDGRIRSQPILSFLPEAIDTPSKKVRVYELSPLASTDKRSYDELVAFFTKNERCPVVDKEYNMGILLYFVPPKLIFKKVDPAKGQQKGMKKNKKNKRGKGHKTNFVELLKLNGNGKVSDDRLWMISITSTSKYLMFKRKMKEKEMGKENGGGKGKGKGKGKRKDGKKKKRDDAELSDIEISTDEDDSENDDKDRMEVGSDDEEDENGRKVKGDDIVKSELIVALEELYGKIGQKLPD